jgi:hypothetical protein
MGIVVIAAHRPKPSGKRAGRFFGNRVPTLKKKGLVTDRKWIIMHGCDGTIIEVSNWESQAAI